jgi:uncharacterized protein (TIGR02145 family)
LEYWNGREWISLCQGDDPCADLDAENGYTLCSPATVANLPSRIQWYAAESGGSSLAPAHTLAAGEHTLYAGNCEGAAARIPVRVNVVSCAAITPANSRVTTYMNVMYDFQRQELEAYVTGGGQVTAWQWQVSKTRTGTYTDISGATQSTYTVEPHFINAYPGAANDELFFKCKLFNPATPAGVVQTDANALGIEFIHTEGTGYGESGGVKYLDIESGNAAAPYNGKLRIALLNVGANEDNKNFGDFYQWARIADGHQVTEWKKNSSRVNTIGTAAEWGVSFATSAVAVRSASQVYTNYTTDTYAGQPTPATRNFIPSVSDWGEQSTASNARWGNSSNTRAAAANSLTSGTGRIAWSFPNNNVCPTGWRVPSRFELWDMYRGSGSDNPVNETANPYGAITGTTTTAGSGPLNNGWRFRVSANNAYGGVIITNANDEKVFLPAAGFRNYSNGALTYGGSYGYYWSSTYNNTANTYSLSFYNTHVYAGSNGNSARADGFSVRCIAEF